MALNVTPTSGAEPYTLTIDLENKLSIDGITYDMAVRFSSTPGTCPVPAGSPSQVVRAALLNQGYYVRDITVPVGSCGVYKVDIIDLATSDIISTESVSIDNLE